MSTHSPPPSPAGVGLEIGSVSVKWVASDGAGTTSHQVLLHGGAPRNVVEKLFAEWAPHGATPVVITGQAAQVLLDLPYCSTTECLELALRSHDLKPDLLLSLGGETFRAYPMKNGTIRNVISTSKCAAGTGEFIVQQFQRMGMSLPEGIEQGLTGRRVPLATRCSVHCKSDATHMLNKGECTPGDIAASLIADLAQRAAELVTSAQWPLRTVVLAGGVTRNHLLIDQLSKLLDSSRIVVLPESSFLEAQGAYHHASRLPTGAARQLTDEVFSKAPVTFQTLPPLTTAESLLDFRVTSEGSSGAITEGGTYLLGLDAGSTTTKAVLLDGTDGSVAASCYLRTLGNPIVATRQCLRRLGEQVGDPSLQVSQIATTGSGREMVSVYLNNCPTVNEIVAHARAAAHYLPEVSTVFEIGGQDSKFISFLHGVPVDYAMNEGCSAGTGSFLEESASLDMNIEMGDISAIAEQSPHPIAFGERCAAFINTDLRNALQQGASPADVVAGLVYSIADNYISRVVGPRQLGNHVLFLGGVALNRAVALAIAARTKRPVVVPPHPELMGCIGAAFEARDRLQEGTANDGATPLDELAQGEMTVTGTFRCRSCDNNCELKKISVGGRVYPFGGLCPKYEMQRRGNDSLVEGRDLVAWRNQLMFEDYGPEPVVEPRGRIGVPLALTSFELFPLYAKLVTELGYDVVVSDTAGSGSVRTEATMCYPCQVAQRAVQNLLNQQVDYVLLPRVIELEIPDDALHSYTCPSTSTIPDIIRAALPRDAHRILSPHIGLSPDLGETTLLEIERLAPILGIDPATARTAGQRAIRHYQAFKQAYQEQGRDALIEIAGEPTVVVAGRPYSVCSSEVNLALPRKIVGRGFHAVPADMLPLQSRPDQSRDVWHFTQQISNAIGYVADHREAHICLVSCFSCGPDSVVYHDLRHQLSGTAFCYLEIDSHTAHAGFETRVGAFLDIVEKRSQTPTGSPASRGEEPPFLPARLADDRDGIIDSDGCKVAYDDPRVVHVLTDVTNPFASRLIQAVYQKAGRRCRVAGRASLETLELAKGLCSGRECVPLIATAGAALKDLGQARAADEITLYLTLDQEGPCQNGAWPLVWQVFVQRLQARNIIGGVNRCSRNQQLGLDGSQVAEIGRCVLLGDLLEEAHHSLACLASDRKAALQRFDDELEQLATALASGKDGLTDGLEHWARTMAELPLREPIEEATKVLIFGGLNLAFVHYPVSDYFITRGVIPKVVDVAEGIASIASEGAIRCGLKYGHVDPLDQLKFSPPRANREDFIAARMARFGVATIESQMKTLREVMTASGLLFDEPIGLADLLAASAEVVSNCGFTETGVTVGRFACSVRQGLYDGLVNLGCFNCQPAMSSQAIIRPLAGNAEVPYVAIDCEGPWISANQTEVLETIAIQAQRVRQQKNRSAETSGAER